MKKIIATLVLISMTGFFFASCNKTGDWQCTCEKDGAIVYNYTASGTKKKDESKDCKRLEEEITGASCKLTKQ